MLDHVGIQCADLARSAAFYDAVLAPLGASRLMDFGVAMGYGVAPHPDFWIGAFDSGDGFRESHLAFTASSRDVVRAFFDAAVASGAEVLHEPGCGRSTTSTTSARSSETPTGTTSKPSATCRATEPPEAESHRLNFPGRQVARSGSLS